MTTKECFENFVGLRGFCTDTPPISGKFVNTLPGISLKSIANLSSEEVASYKEVFDDVYDYALNELEADVDSKMRNFFKANVLLDHEQVGRFVTPETTEASSNELKGITLRIFNGKNTQIVINHIDLFLATAINSDITIYDYDSGRVLETISFTGVVGLNTIQINKIFPVGGQKTRLFVSYDGSLSATIESKQEGLDPKFGGVTVRGARITKGQTVLKANLNFDGLTHGMVINFSLECSTQNFLCNIRNLLGLSLYYKLGEALMIERLASDRLNFYTLVNQDKIGELRDFYKEKYEAELESKLDNVQPEYDGICFPCEKKRMYKFAHP